MTEVKVEVVTADLSKVELVYERAADVLLEQLSALRGAFNPTTHHATMQTIDVVGRLTCSLFPIVAAIQSEREDDQEKPPV